MRRTKTRQDVLNCRETMALLRVSRPTVLALLKARKLKGFRRGKIIRISRASVERLLGEGR